MTVIRLLGSIDLRDASGSEVSELLRRPKRLALLAYLAGNAPQAFHRRDRLLAVFWPESTTKQARHGLRQALYELKKLLGEGLLCRRGSEEIALDWDEVTCDVSQFRAAVAEGRLDQAVELYRGDFLDGFFVSGAPDFMDWMDRRRAEILRAVTDASWQLADQRHAQGDHHGAAAAAYNAFERAPTDEVGARRLINLLHEAGNPGGAFRVYDRLVRRMANEFEAMPSAETNALIAQIREEGAVVGGDGTLPPLLAQAPVASSPGAPRTKGLWNRPATAGTLFGVASLGILAVVRFLMMRLALPDWVLSTAAVLLILGLPIIVATVVAEERRDKAADNSGKGWLTWPRALFGGAVAASGLVVVTAGFMGLRAIGVGTAATLLTAGTLEPLDRIILADFSNRTADSTLTGTLTELLRIDLSQSRTVRLVDPATVLAAVGRAGLDPGVSLGERLAMDVAEREGIKAVLVGDVERVGGGYVLSARLISPGDGALIAAERVTADGETRLIAAMDGLSARIRERVGESLKDIRASPPLDRVTTSSLAALRKYTQAMRPVGPNGVVVDPYLLEEAVALDPLFAMAHRRLGIVLLQRGHAEAGRDAIRRAFELSARLPLVEQHLIRGLYFTRLEYDPVEVEMAYRAVLALDPDNQVALVNLAAHQSLARMWEERESLALEALAVRWSGIAFAHAFSAQLAQGKFEEASAMLERLVADGAPYEQWRFMLAAAQRDYDGAERALEGVENRVGWQRLGLLNRLRGRMVEAERLFAGTAPDGQRGPLDVRRSLHLAALEADHGSAAEAVRVLRPFSKDRLPASTPGFLDRAELLAAIGRVDDARALIADFESLLAAGIRRHPENLRALARVEGEIALSEARYSDAVIHFTRVAEWSAACTTCGLARLAESLVLAGQPDAAVSVLERMLSSPTTGLSDDDARWVPGSTRRLGELYEARGDTAKAVDAYRDFVWLWKDADAELQPQVDDVRQRIERLGGE